MATIQPEQPFPSTPFGWRRVKLSEHPQGTSTARRNAAPPPRKRRRDLSQRLQVTIIYRGGPECSYLVSFEDRSWRFCGAEQLHDVVQKVCRSLT